jgi:ribulose-5-phosphate 4-epimerase/fuculose-1-phosphate aldolase
MEEIFTIPCNKKYKSEVTYTYNGEEKKVLSSVFESYFFTRDGDSKDVKCKHCPETYSCGLKSGYSNVRSHLNVNHSGWEIPFHRYNQQLSAASVKKMTGWLVAQPPVATDGGSSVLNTDLNTSHESEGSRGESLSNHETSSSESTSSSQEEKNHITATTSSVTIPKEFTEIPRINGGCLDCLPILPAFPSSSSSCSSSISYELYSKRAHYKRILALSFRLFSKLGYDEGVAGHITVRDTIDPTTFWMNPFGVDFSEITVSNLLLINSEGKILEDPLNESQPWKYYTVNKAAFAIHSAIHQARPDVICAVHAHSLYGKTWSIFGKLLEPLTQDSCAFYEDHSIYSSYNGVVFDLPEGKRIASSLGNKKAVILQNHGLLTVGKESIEEAIWWFVSMEKCCHVQLLAEQATNGRGEGAQSNYLRRALIPPHAALQAYNTIGKPYSGWYQCQMLLRKIQKEQPDCLL